MLAVWACLHLLNGGECAGCPAKVRGRVGPPVRLRWRLGQLVNEEVLNVQLEGLPR